MSVNRFQYIDLRVCDMKAAYPFYARLLSAVGFPTEDSTSSVCRVNCGPVNANHVAPDERREATRHGPVSRSARRSCVAVGLRGSKQPESD
jgi:hypothetical protein